MKKKYKLKKKRQLKVDIQDFRLRISEETKLNKNEIKDVYQNMSDSDNARVIFRLKNRIEIDLKEMIDDSNIPKPIEAENGFLL